MYNGNLLCLGCWRRSKRVALELARVEGMDSVKGLCMRWSRRTTLSGSESEKAIVSAVVTGTTNAWLLRKYVIARHLMGWTGDYTTGLNRIASVSARKDQESKQLLKPQLPPLELRSFTSSQQTRKKHVDRASETHSFKSSLRLGC